jgi:hypothetical protein
MGLCCTPVYIFTTCFVNTVLLALNPIYEDRIIGTDGEQEQSATDRKTDTQNLKRQLSTSWDVQFVHCAMVHDTAYIIFLLTER